jgi:hypothetical protein
MSDGINSALPVFVPSQSLIDGASDTQALLLQIGLGVSIRAEKRHITWRKGARWKPEVLMVIVPDNYPARDFLVEKKFTKVPKYYCEGGTHQTFSLSSTYMPARVLFENLSLLNLVIPTSAFLNSLSILWDSQ